MEVTHDQVNFALAQTCSQPHTNTHTHVRFVSHDTMVEADGWQQSEGRDGQMNLICLNAGELRCGGALHQCITTTAVNACIKVNQLPIDKILQFA